ncbi:carbohydrate ABC transporter permease [Xylanimonas sp. McL0601]|uniref:carbohydrate ABC transporter permease n=1 Tax=Xylanimonas sp. McL0601 TaxID=3414739 RepID=UPI003CED58E2
MTAIPTLTRPSTAAAPDAPRRSRSVRTESRATNAVLFVVLAIFAVAMAAPLLWMFTTAIKTKAEVFALPPILWPDSPQWDTFVRMWSDAPILSGFKNSFIVATTVTVIGSFSSALAAFTLAKLRLPYKNAIFLGLLTGLMVPYPTVMIPQFVMFSRLHWVDTLLPLIVPLLFGNIIMIFFLRQYLETVPDSLIEAAKIDGASYFTIFSRLVLPLIRPAIAAQFILWFMAVWNDYLAPVLYLNSPEKQTLQVVIANLNVEFATQRDYPLIMGASFVALLPILIVFLVFQRQIIESVALTGTKG